MTRKRDTLPEALLQRVITDLETSDEPPPSKAQPATPAYERLRAMAVKLALVHYRGALLALLSHGPLLCTPTRDPDPLVPIERPPDEYPDDTILLVRAEVLAVLRQAVRLRASGDTGYGIALLSPPQFFVRLVEHRALIEVKGLFRDLVVLQLVAVLERVGLDTVRACAAADCPRLYVKTYRREFCSLTCQRRTLKQRERHAAREKRAHQQRQRARRRRAQHGRG